MNGYELMSQSYKKLAQEGKIPKEDAEKEIRIYDFLATCSKDDLNRMVDSSAFNDIIRGYITLAVNNSDISKESRNKILAQLRYLFDWNNAEDALKAYLNN